MCLVTLWFGFSDICLLYHGFGGGVPVFRYVRAVFDVLVWLGLSFWVFCECSCRFVCYVCVAK